MKTMSLACDDKSRQRKAAALLQKVATTVFASFAVSVACLLAMPVFQLANAHSLLQQADGNSRSTQNYYDSYQKSASSNLLPGAQSGQQQNKCSSGWMWFNNKCWVATSSRRDWTHAFELCKRLYGDSTLPTIHSEEENEFLRNNVELRNSPIWLYARYNHQYSRLRWMDKSPANYTRWDAGQPSEKASMVCIKTEDNWYMRKTEPKNGDTECVSFWEDAKWTTSVGCSVLLPVVCEIKLSAISRLPDSNASSALFGEVTSALGSSSSAHSLHYYLTQQFLLATIVAAITIIATTTTSLSSRKQLQATNSQTETYYTI